MASLTVTPGPHRSAAVLWSGVARRHAPAVLWEAAASMCAGRCERHSAPIKGKRRMLAHMGVGKMLINSDHTPTGIILRLLARPEGFEPPQRTDPKSNGPA
jgi:hypothetical protein